MKENAYITLLTTDNYIYYIIGLFESYKKVNSKYKMYCAITDNISQNTKNILDKIGMPYVYIDITPLQEFINHSSSLGMISKYKQASNKLAIFGLTQFNKCVYIDSDMLMLQNIDELFDKPDFSSVEDCLPVHYRPAEYTLGESAFCAGMFVFSPSAKTYNEILELIKTLPKNIKWNDQNILAYYTRDWMKKPELHLSCEYELNIAANENVYQTYIDLGGKDENIKVKHYVTYKNAPFEQVEYLADTVVEEYIKYYQFINEAILKNQLDLKIVNINNLKSKPKIDLVVPFVDNTDPKWQQLFNQYKKKINTSTENIAGKTRFRSDKDFFRYFFRCISKNMPWINNIFLLVQSESQVPEWVKTIRGQIRIITHDKFIPKKYLPTFNSGTIEMFLWNIPGLAEHFIYTNDDIYVVNNLTQTDFFENNMPKFNALWDRDYYSNEWRQMCQNNHDLIFGTNKAVPYLRLDHEFRPYLRSKMKECYVKYEQQILDSISQFRDKKNLTVYLFSLYLVKNNLQGKSAVKNRYLCSTSKIIDIKNGFESSDVICINDTKPDIDICNTPEVKWLFYSKFDKKSKYELFDLENKPTQPKAQSKSQADGRPGCYLYF